MPKFRHIAWGALHQRSYPQWSDYINTELNICLYSKCAITEVLQYMFCSHHMYYTLQWRHNEHGGVSNHQPHDCLLNRLFRRRSNKTSKLRVTGLCVGNSPVTSEFPAQMASNAANVSIWWHYHVNGARLKWSAWRRSFCRYINIFTIGTYTYMHVPYLCV